jgi:uncharacterized membrane protein (DUF4010 family)
MGPMDVWNPRAIWLIVVLVIGISLGGYVAQKLLGPRGGTIATGILGGVISSTAATVSYSQRVRQDAGEAAPAALVIGIATFVVYFRILVLIGVFGPKLLPHAAVPIGIMCGAAAAAVAIAWFRMPDKDADGAAPENPTGLKSALIFAAVLALVLLLVEGGRRWLGSSGVYAVSALAGLVDLDAITLSDARLAQSGSIEPGHAWRAIVIAVLANLGFKLGVSGVMGSRRLLLLLAAIFGLQAAVGVLLLIVW